MRRLFLSIIAVMSAWALPVTLAGGVFGHVAHAQDGHWQPDPEEQWLFDLRTERFSLGQGIRGYARGDAVCVDLGDMIRALDLPIRVNRELRRATGWAFDERRTLLIDREAGRIEVGSATHPLRPGDIIDTPEGWCVNPDRLAEWLGVSFAVDLSNSIIRIRSETPLPFELAAERRARASRAQPQAFNLSDLPQRSRPYALLAAPSVDVIATAEFRRNSAGASDGRARYEIFASGELLGASVNARLASDDNALPTSLRVSAYRADPAGTMLGPLRATQIAAGDVTGIMTPIGLESGIGRGALVTNQPLDRPAAFDRTQFRGDMPAGWEAELYRNGQLLAFASANASGRYEFLDVELIYGMNQFEIVLYGPQGQVRRDIRSIPVGLDSIPSGQTHYWAGVLEEGVDLLPLGDPTGDPLRRGWRAVLAIERGLDPKTGVSLFATTRRYDRRRYSAIEAALRRALGSTLLEAAGSWQSGGGWAGRLFWTGAFGRSSFQAESLWLNNGYVSDRLPPGVTGAHSLSWQVPVRIVNIVLPTQWDGRLRQFADGSRRWEGAGRVSASFNRVSLTTRVQWAQVQRTGFADPPPDLTVGLLASVRLGRVRLRGDARLGLSGQAQTGFTLAADWRSGEASDWRGELGYDRRSRIGRAGLSYTRRFEQFSLTGQGLASTDGALTAALTLSMGIGPDPANGGIRFSRQRLAAEGQVMAEVFRDDNGDGLRQNDEALVPNVVLTAGNAVADRPTNALGRAMIDALPPHRAILIGIDESSLDDPLTRAALPGVVIVPRPGVATRIQLPLVATGEVEGLLLDPAGLVREGVDLELVDSHGAVRARARSDFDGFFLFETVPYGEYSVRVSSVAAATLGVNQPLGTLSLNRQTPRIRLGERRLVPADPAAAAERIAVHHNTETAAFPPGRR
jgi:hypothetical protein